MNKLTSLVFGIAALVGITALFACSSDPGFIGRWKSVSPDNITASVEGASTATSLMTLDFTQDENRDGGNVQFSSDVDITKMEAPDSYSDGVPFRVSVRAKATCSGRWTYDVDDQDDLLLSLDLAGMKVDLNPNDIVLPPAYVAGIPSAKLDSIKGIMVENCRHEISRAVGNEFSRYGVIEDMETDKGRQILKFETKSPETEHHFTRVGI